MPIFYGGDLPELFVNLPNVKAKSKLMNDT